MFGIFIHAKDKPKPPVIEEIARLATQTVVSFWPAFAFFADTLRPLRSKAWCF
jgi:hypothetical protein